MSVAHLIEFLESHVSNSRSLLEYKGWCKNILWLHMFLPKIFICAYNSVIYVTMLAYSLQHYCFLKVALTFFSHMEVCSPAWHTYQFRLPLLSGLGTRSGRCLAIDDLILEVPQTWGAITLTRIYLQSCVLDACYCPSFLIILFYFPKPCFPGTFKDFTNFTCIPTPEQR